MFLFPKIRRGDNRFPYHLSGWQISGSPLLLVVLVRSPLFPSCRLHCRLPYSKCSQLHHIVPVWKPRHVPLGYWWLRKHLFLLMRCLGHKPDLAEEYCAHNLSPDSSTRNMPDAWFVSLQIPMSLLSGRYRLHRLSRILLFPDTMFYRKWQDFLPESDLPKVWNNQSGIPWVEWYHLLPSQNHRSTYLIVQSVSTG